MQELCEAVRQCRGASRKRPPVRCSEKAEFERNGRLVCWSHKHSLSVSFYVDKAVSLETLLKISNTLDEVRRKQPFGQG